MAQAMEKCGTGTEKAQAECNDGWRICGTCAFLWQDQAQADAWCQRQLKLDAHGFVGVTPTMAVRCGRCIFEAWQKRSVEAWQNRYNRQVGRKDAAAIDKIAAMDTTEEMCETFTRCDKENRIFEFIQEKEATERATAKMHKESSTSAQVATQNKSRRFK